PVDRRAVAAVLGTLYDGRVPVLLVGESDHAEGVLAAALSCLPDDLAAAMTFSTGHNPSTAAHDTAAFAVVAAHERPPDVAAFADVIDLERPGEHDPSDLDLRRLVADLVVELFAPFGGPGPTIALARSLRGTSAAQVARALRLAHGRWTDADLVACAEAEQLDVGLIDADATGAGLALLARGELPATPATVAALRDAVARHLPTPRSVVPPVTGLLLAPPDEATIDAFGHILAPEALGTALASALDWATGQADSSRLPEILASAVALAERWGCEGHITEAHRRVAAMSLADLAGAVDRALRAAHSRRSLDALIDASLRWGGLEGATVKALSSDEHVERLIVDRLVALSAHPEVQDRIGLLLGSLPDGGLRVAVDLGHRNLLPRAVVEAAFAAAEVHHDHAALAKSLGKDGRRQLAALVATWCPISALVADQPSKLRRVMGRDEP
ncbi:MAG TPA: hypothetical protein VFU19_13140, partial [Iamia sp.]|nr:hypothetical protein [Iamia sp.]